MNESRYGFLTVRTQSTRLPNKCLLMFGDTTVLEHVIMRTQTYGIEPIVCTTEDASDDVIVETCLRLNIRFFRGDLKNKMERWYKCAVENKVDIFHTIDVDDPFFDGLQVIESLNYLRENQLDVVYPTDISSRGGGSVGYSVRTQCLGALLKDLPSGSDTEMVDVIFDQLSESRKSRLKSKYSDIDNVRLTLDYEEDYVFLDIIRRLVGSSCSRQDIIDLLSRNPDLSNLNWFRNKQWEKNQSVIRQGMGD